MNGWRILINGVDTGGPMFVAASDADAIAMWGRHAHRLAPTQAALLARLSTSGSLKDEECSARELGAMTVLLARGFAQKKARRGDHETYHQADDIVAVPAPEYVEPSDAVIDDFIVENLPTDMDVARAETGRSFTTAVLALAEAWGRTMPEGAKEVGKILLLNAARDVAQLEQPFV